MDQALLKKGNQSIGRGRKGISTKIHLALSPRGIQSVCLSEGQRVDMKIFPKLWQLGDWSEIKYMIAGKGYDDAALRISIRKAEKIPVIPRKANAIVPVYKKLTSLITVPKSAIERFFGQIKENKRLTLRFDKLDLTFFSFFALATIKALGLIC